MSRAALLHPCMDCRTALTTDRVLVDCVDLGQTGVPWVVMAEPEGNEFCVLRSLDRKANEPAD